MYVCVFICGNVCMYVYRMMMEPRHVNRALPYVLETLRLFVYPIPHLDTYLSYILM